MLLSLNVYYFMFGFRPFLLGLLVCLACGATRLELSKKVTETATSDLIKEFVLELPSSVPQGKLFIRAQASTTDLLANPIVSVRKSNTYFDCYQEAPISLCVIDKKDVRESATFNVQVYCMTECEFDLVSYIDSTYQLAINEDVAFVLENGSSVFEATANVPKDLDYSQIKILVDLQNPEDANGPLNLFVNAGSNVPRPTPQSYSIKGQDIWSDGKGVFLTKQTVKPGQTIKVYVSGQKDMQLVLRCFSVKGNQRTISLNQKIYDDVTKNNTKLFVLDLSQEDDLSNKDIYIKLMKFAGSSRIIVSPDANFILNKTVQSQTFENVAQVTLTPSTKKSLGYNKQVWIAVSGDLDSTFALQTSSSSQNFTVLDSEISELSDVSGKEVDNFLYSFVGEASDDISENVREFTMGAKVYSGNLEYGVRRCMSLEENGTYECLLPTIQNVNMVRDTFNQITGELSEKNSIKYFTFRYDIRKCTAQGKPLYKCAFQIVCFSSDPQSTDLVKYTLNFEEKGQEIILQQGIARKDRAFKGHTRQYYFALPQTQDVLEVKFYLTVISGECMMIGATDRRDHSINDPQVKLAIDDTLSFKNQSVSKQYFLKVESQTNSLYSVRAVVKRKSDPSASAKLDDRIPIYLSEGISQMVAIDGDEPQGTRFYISLSKPKPFSVQISSPKPVDFEVRQSKKYETQHKPIWKSENNRVDVPDSKSQEFIVIIKGKVTNLITIVYYEVGTCPIYKLGKAVQLDIGEMESQCIKFHLTKNSDMEIVIGSSYFELTTGNLVVVVGQGSNTRQLVGRISVIKSDEVMGLCYQDTEGRLNTTDCMLTVNITASKDASPTIIAQYIDDELELFDGVQQISKGFLSRGAGRFFYHSILNKNKPIMIALKSLSDVKYRIVCQITDWKRYVSADTSKNGTAQFPKFDQKTAMKAETIEIGSTALVIKTDELAKHTSENSLLLISVYSLLIGEIEADFTIEVIQTFSKLRASEAKMGYVDVGDSRRYQIESDGTQQMLVHLNSYQVFCAKIELYTLTSDENVSNTALSRSMMGELMVSPTNEPTKYIIHVEGLSSCSYELSYTTLDQRVYELIHGHMFNLQLRQDEKAYFIYYHNRQDSFRVVSMSEFGEVEFNAKTIKPNEVGRISDVIKNLNGRFEFGGPSYTASLVVASGTPHFCGNCYYLIEVSSDAPASCLVVLHSISSPVAIRDNRVVRETLTSENPEVTYAYMKITPFKVTIGLMFGQLQFSVTNTINASFSMNQTINESKVIDIQYEDMSKSNDSIYNNAAFLIKIKCEKSCRYSLAIDSAKFPRRMIEGVSFNLQVASATNGSCVQFLSLEQDTPTNIHISSQNISNLKYDLKCFSKETWNECPDSRKNGGLVISQQKNDQILNVEMRSIRGYYYLCLTLIDEKLPQNVSLLHSENINARYIHINTNNMISVSSKDPEVTLEMFNPSNHSIMIELFQCKGEVQFEASVDYKKFVDSNSSSSEHSKTAGHYVVKMDPNETSSSLVFSRVKLKDQKNQSQATFILRYSEFEPYKYPYSALAAEETTISYHIDNEKITFLVYTVEPNSHYNVISYQYKLFVASDQKSIKSAAQCDTQTQIVQVHRVSPNQALSMETMSFEVDLDAIRAVIPEDSNYFFVGASCLLEVVPSNTDSSGSHNYKIVYDSIQLALSKQASRSMATFKTKVKFVFLWVIFPILLAAILLYLAMKYCMNRVKYLPESELIEEAEQVNYTQATTNKQLVGTTTNTQDRPRMEEN